ncbi:MAG TPA: hypothetical protein VMN60_11785 [Longimicrobiales bacterium]|nr:hypothetical protein [Longimicrobiales bacterium]
MLHGVNSFAMPSLTAAVAAVTLAAAAASLLPALPARRTDACTAVKDG